jgi:hypothetical protein
MCSIWVRCYVTILLRCPFMSIEKSCKFCIFPAKATSKNHTVVFFNCQKFIWSLDIKFVPHYDLFFWCIFFFWNISSGVFNFQGKAKKVVVVGGGYIGMEIAAAAVAWKLDTTVCVFPTFFFLWGMLTKLFLTLFKDLLVLVHSLKSQRSWKCGLFIR